MSRSLHQAEPLLLKFDKDRVVSPFVSGLKASVQGQIIFIGDYWLVESEARELLAWLGKVLP